MMIKVVEVNLLSDFHRHANFLDITLLSCLPFHTCFPLYNHWAVVATVNLRVSAQNSLMKEVMT